MIRFATRLGDGLGSLPARLCHCYSAFATIDIVTGKWGNSLRKRVWRESRLYELVVAL